MADSSKISVRLTSEIQALLSDHVRHGRRVSDIIRTALEGYLGVRPTEGPTERPTALQLSDAVSDMSDKLTRLASDVSDIRIRIERLEAGKTGPSRVRQEQSVRPTTRPTPQSRASSPRRPGRPSSPLRQQILDLLQAHPEGLRAEELRVYLQVRRPIGDTLQGMLKGGVIMAQGHGSARRYVVTA